MFLYNTGKAGHTSRAVWDAQGRGPGKCTMQIYENNMQISIVLVSQYKQTNKWWERLWLLCRRENPWLYLKGCSGVCVYVSVHLCACVCVHDCVCACAHTCRVTEDKQWNLNAPRKWALQLFVLVISWDARTSPLARNLLLSQYKRAICPLNCADRSVVA